ncbi:hypothetical protein BIU82_06325 [Arthrobacter sp. SW1]|uniref:hypothetical protein n=1 Tax=Arthrobacter sp. SW1 TaxID=1920889 RepID=UPI000877C50E|nr:hypothetical protein [Arthrobacter sp. SW1]OFI38110.1 hypothetical protein BIU82_06325 [Arthrobacter sp. SW1]
MKRKSAPLVHDGIQNPAHLVPRDAYGEAGDDGPEVRAPRNLGGESTGLPGMAGSKDPSGPAEEKDDATVDDRSLTTKLSPSD